MQDKRKDRIMGKFTILPSGVLSILCVFLMFGGAQAAEKQRIVVMTDIGGDPDDIQSMVRFMLYTCDFDVEGFCTGFGHGHYKNTRPELIRNVVEAYGKVFPNLKKHRPDYPSKESLMRLIKDGHNGDPHKVGQGMDSEASDWIIKVLDRDDPRPVWFSIWGGPRELAQAIWKVQQTRSAKEVAKFKQKIRVHSIADQDRTAGWVKEHHPDVFWIYSRSLFRGIWKEGDQSIVSPKWLERHVRNGHGPLGPAYPSKAAGKAGVKEGDTPSFFYVLPDGLSEPEHPEWGNWGGRFRRSGRGNEYIPAEDQRDGRPDMLYTIHRWRRAYQNAFGARMDWCVKSYKECNHEPAAVCNGDKSRGVLRITVDPGGSVKLSAAGSSDPDSDMLSHKWWVYKEAGTYWDEAPIRGANAVEAVVNVPKNASGRTIHVILEVVDDGIPSLTTYRRVILKVRGKAVDVPPDARWDERFLDTPITKLSGPPAKTGKWAFYRGINLNGPAIEIDGNMWEGDNARNFICRDRVVNSPNVLLRPPTNKARAKMIHSFRWNRQAKITLSRVRDGNYAVYAYVWEDNNPETFSISLGGKEVIRDFYSGQEGQWRRLGPWITTVTDGTIEIRSRGGAANFSGIEVWKRVGDGAS
jgi:hypothetical protein